MPPLLQSEGVFAMTVEVWLKADAVLATTLLLSLGSTTQYYGGDVETRLSLLPQDGGFVVKFSGLHFGSDLFSVTTDSNDVYPASSWVHVAVVVESGSMPPVRM